MYCNIIHRTGNANGLESLKFQQDCAHSFGFKTTLLIPLASMESKEVVDYYKSQAEQYGDEIGIHFHHISSDLYKNEFHNNEKEVAVYLKPFEERRKIISFIFEKFYELFGYYPVSIGGYYFDSKTLMFIKDKYPTVKIAIASCFEEGVKMFAGCLHGWYVFSEGGPWGAYYPSKENSLCPAKNKDDAIDIIAVPHLNRDMLMSYIGRDDWFSSHTANMQRGKVNKGKKCKYLYDFFDEWLTQDNYNDSVYYNFFVGSGWLNEGRNFEETSEDSKDLYRQSLAYCKEKQDDGKVNVLTMAEYAEKHAEIFKIGRGDSNLWHDLLCGSKRDIFWYADSFWRVALDPNAGASLVDLRPYAGRLEQDLGPNSKDMWNGSYPFALSETHRNAFASSTIGCEDGGIGFYNSRTNIKNVIKKDSLTIVELGTFEFCISGNKIVILPTFIFNPDGSIIMKKKIVSAVKTDIEYAIKETVKGTFGKTEYPEDLAETKLVLIKNDETLQNLNYEYKNRTVSAKNVKYVFAEIPMLNSILEFTCNSSNCKGEIHEGSMFDPYYYLSLTQFLKVGEESEICLRIKRLK